MTKPYFTNQNRPRPQNIKRKTSQQPLIYSYSNLEPELGHQTRFYKSLKVRHTLIENNLNKMLNWNISATTH
jgi:hypothetical protein